MAIIDNTWNWRQLSPVSSPSQRTFFHLAYAGSNKVLLYGGLGYATPLSPSTTQPYSDTWLLDGDEWSELSPSTVPPARYGYQAAYLNDKIYMQGGYDFAPTAFDNTYKFDLSTLNWSLVATATTSLEGAYPKGESVNGIMVGAGDRLYFLLSASSGGLGNTTWQFTEGAGDWSHLTLGTEFATDTANGPWRRRMAGAYGAGKFVSIAGEKGGGDNTNDILEFGGSNWVTTIPIVPSITAPYPRRNLHRACWTGDQIFFYGGSDFPSGGGDTHGLGDQWLYDPATNSLTELSTVTTPGTRAEYGMAWDGHRVVLFGGWHNYNHGQFLGDTWVLEPPTTDLYTAPGEYAVYHNGAWHLMPSMVI